ncbi:MAG: GNAT family N-acetyltransferase [Acidimicrobiales bacterium]
MALLPISGPTVVIDRLAPHDAPALSASHSDATNARYQGWRSPLSEGEALELIAEMSGIDVLTIRGDGVQLAIRMAAGGPLVGDLYLVRSTAEAHVAEVGITLVPDSHGRGLATAAVRAVLAALLGAPAHGITRVDAYLDIDNERSQALFERLGFLPLARVEGASHRRDGTTADELHYAMDRATWLALHR